MTKFVRMYYPMGLEGKTLADVINDEIKGYPEKSDNLGHLKVENIWSVNVQKIGGTDTYVVVQFEVEPLTPLELALIENSR